MRRLQLSLSRIGLTEEVQLSRLGGRSVAQLAGTILGGDPPAELLALLAERSAGTPLFVGELIQALLDGGQLLRSGDGWALGPDAGAVLPASVRDLILERLERLGPDDRRVLDLIAVYGDGVRTRCCARPAGSRTRGCWSRCCACARSGSCAKSWSATASPTA